MENLGALQVQTTRKSSLDQTVQDAAQPSPRSVEKTIATSQPTLAASSSSSSTRASNSSSGSAFTISATPRVTDSASDKSTNIASSSIAIANPSQNNAPLMPDYRQTQLQAGLLKQTGYIGMSSMSLRDSDDLTPSEFHRPASPTPEPTPRESDSTVTNSALPTKAASSSAEDLPMSKIKELAQPKPGVKDESHSYKDTEWETQEYHRTHDPKRMKSIYTAAGLDSDYGYNRHLTNIANRLDKWDSHLNVDTTNGSSHSIWAQEHNHKSAGGWTLADTIVIQDSVEDSQSAAAAPAVPASSLSALTDDDEVTSQTVTLPADTSEASSTMGSTTETTSDSEERPLPMDLSATAQPEDTDPSDLSNSLRATARAAVGLPIGSPPQH